MGDEAVSIEKRVDAEIRYENGIPVEWIVLDVTVDVEENDG